MYLEVAPTSCILLIRNLCEKRAILKVLLISITDIKNSITNIPLKMKLILRILLLISLIISLE